MIRPLLFTILAISAYVEANDGAARCMSIKDDKNRLACYDRFFNQQEIKNNQIYRNQSLDNERISRLNPIPSKNKIENPKKILNKSLEVKDSFESNFGLKHSKIPNNEKENIFIVTSIIKVNKDKNNKIIFTMENDQVWVADSNYRSRNMFKMNSDIKIEEAPVSGFKMVNIKTNENIRIKRLR